MGLIKDIKDIEYEKVIIATNDTIYDIVNSEINRLGNNANLNHIDVSNVTNMRELFYGSKFNGDISKWDVSNVIDMCSMFDRSKFNRDLSMWQINPDCVLVWMFHYCPLEHQPDKWPQAYKDLH